MQAQLFSYTSLHLFLLPFLSPPLLLPSSIFIMQYMAMPALVPLLWNPTVERPNGGTPLNDGHQSFQQHQMQNQMMPLFPPVIPFAPHFPNGGTPLNDGHQSFQQHQIQYRMMPLFPAAIPCVPHFPPHTSLSADIHFVLNLIDSQRQEMEQCLHQQNYHLAEALQRQQKELLLFTLRKFESKTSNTLREKDEQLARIGAIPTRFQELLRRVEDDRLAWQRRAIENEAVAQSLGNTLDRVSEPCLSSTEVAGAAVAETAASCSAFPSKVNGGTADPTAETSRGRYACKSCGSRDACMLLLPCKHVCLCSPCEAELGVCPVCASAKRGGIEVFLA